MQVSVESTEGLERRMTVELPAEQVNEALEKRLKELARSVRLDGFRPGKVPLSVVRKRYAGQVRAEVFGDLVQSSYFEALTDQNLSPAGEPNIEPIEKPDGEGMGYVAIFEIMPEVTLNSLSEKVIKRPQVEVTDADLQEMLTKLQKQRATWNEVEREGREGDQLTIDFKGFIDGEAFDGGSADGVPLTIGSSTMIPGFEDGLIGARAGESRTLEIPFPESYQVEKLAGKDARFEVKVLKVAEPVLPELDEEFVKAFGVTEGGLEALQREIRSNMERELSDKIQNLLKEQAMDALLEAHSVEVPKALIQREAESLLKQTKENMTQTGRKSDVDLPASLFEEQAERRVKLGLIIGEVIKQNAIEVDQDRVRAKVEQLAQSYEDPQEVLNYYYGNREQLAGIENVVLEDQVVDWVMQQAQVEERVSGFDELMNPSDDQGSPKQ